MPDETRRARPTGDVVAVWLLFGVVLAAVFGTYARLDPGVLYHTSTDGLAGGAGRALVFLNFPTAVAAVGVVAVLLERGAPRVPAVAAILMCALVPWTVDQDDLDARWINVVPALGVTVALALTIAARPALALAARRPLDGARTVVGLALVVLAVPWWFAELGFYAPDPIYADEATPGETISAVHLGHHHGTDGVLLALTALLLTRVARTRAAQALLAFMFAYGLGNAAQDAWLEQVEKRGWTDAGLPLFLLPSTAWLALAAVAAAAYALIRAREAGAA